VRFATFAPLVLVGLVSFFFVQSKQGDGGTLAARQQQAQALTPTAVANVVKAAPDPVTRAQGVQARCTPLGQGDLLNPWRCSISYASGRDIQYRVTIAASGSYIGDHELVHYRGQRYHDTGVISGCCVPVP